MSIIAVICIHVTGGGFEKYIIDNRALLWVFSFVHYISSFAVPMFLVISGVSLSVNYQKSFSLYKYFYARIMAVLPQYLFFSLLYIFVFRWGNLPSVKDFYVILTSTGAYYHFWFFYLLFWCYLLYPIIAGLINELQQFSNKILAGLFFLSVGLWTLVPFIQYKLLQYLFFFVLGIYLSENLTILKFYRTKTLILTVLGLTVVATVLKSYGLVCLKLPLPAKYISAICFFTAVLQLPLVLLIYKLSLSKLSNNNLLKLIGSHSFGIYLVHAMVLDLSAKIFLKIGLSPQTTLFYLLLFIVTIFVSYTLIVLVKKIPYSRYVVGKIKS